ncbi:hypothetical protein AR438_01105 [Chryseobacterium aquaticum]|uniref:Glycine zipper domain-containing protein n=2 Tax=Chryseobacterium aquaticum TaxID=452084 RepID=A0A0Q3HVC5_9FLAO|nr:hypothetical protein AR438_01105 [Chryseobacterium aquaticum]
MQMEISVDSDYYIDLLVVGTSILVGAEAGSAYPGYGTVIGAGVGAIFGTAELLYDQYNQYVKPVMLQKVNHFRNQFKFTR